MRNDLEKEVTGYEKINETSVGSVQEERRRGAPWKTSAIENISNGDREKLTDLNDISEIDLAVFSVRGVCKKGKEPKMALKCIWG